MQSQGCRLTCCSSRPPRRRAKSWLSCVNEAVVEVCARLDLRRPAVPPLDQRGSAHRRSCRPPRRWRKRSRRRRSARLHRREAGVRARLDLRGFAAPMLDQSATGSCCSSRSCPPPRHWPTRSRHAGQAVALARTAAFWSADLPSLAVPMLDQGLNAGGVGPEPTAHALLEEVAATLLRPTVGPGIIRPRRYAGSRRRSGSIRPSTSRRSNARSGCDRRCRRSSTPRPTRLLDQEAATPKGVAAPRAAGIRLVCTFHFLPFHRSMRVRSLVPL